MTRRAHRLAWPTFIGCGLYVFVSPGPSWASVIVALATILSGSVLIRPPAPPISPQDTTGNYPSWSSIAQDGRP